MAKFFALCISTLNQAIGRIQPILGLTLDCRLPRTSDFGLPAFSEKIERYLKNDRWTFFTFLFLLTTSTCLMAQEKDSRHRVIISTDIGGTDPDDFQSMIHFLMYADQFDVNGLISSPHGRGRKEDILQMLNLYENDFPKLKAKSAGFPTANELRVVTKQGETERAPGKGWRRATEGSDWIIQCAEKEDDRPLWILVWGGIEDVVQALHDSPEILPKLRVYWIGGPNKKWGAEAYHYMIKNFPDLWMIETNATYRGWFDDKGMASDLSNKSFPEKYLRNSGFLGDDFMNYYKGSIKMGDTPSLAYLQKGDAENPTDDSWGGSFTPIRHSSRRIYKRATTLEDKVPAFCMMEFEFQGPDKGPANDESYFVLEISGQQFEGYYMGEGIYSVRFVPKSAGKWTYRTISEIPELDGHTGKFTSFNEWPGEPHLDDYSGLKNWWSDKTDKNLYVGGHQGAATIKKWREEYLTDWAQRTEWLKD